MKPKKLIRIGTTEKLKPGEVEEITEQAELNDLYILKVREELLEIVKSDFQDINEFADLIQVAFDFAHVNGIGYGDLFDAINTKVREKGNFRNLALNNLNPENPSNALYFDNHIEQKERMVSIQQGVQERMDQLKIQQEEWLKAYLEGKAPDATNEMPYIAL